MKLPLGTRQRSAFTLLELLVVVAVILILAAIWLPTGGSKSPATRIACLSNQKQVALGLMLFNSDHQNAFPWQASVTNGGTLETSGNGDVVPCYATVTNYIHDPSIFLCRTDKARSVALPGATLSRANVSYFISLDASSTNSPTFTILTGDRHLMLNSKPVGPGLFPLATNQTLEWSAELHSANKKPMGGVFSFADGHTEWVSVKSLSQVVARQNLPTNRLAVP